VETKDVVGMIDKTTNGCISRISSSRPPLCLLWLSLLWERHNATEGGRTRLRTVGDDDDSTDTTSLIPNKGGDDRKQSIVYLLQKKNYDYHKVHYQ
jgi:hypothetical protein